MHNNKFVLGINAFNIRAGGGVTHLIEFLSHAEIQNYNFEKVVIWASTDILKKIENKKWVEKIYTKDLDKSSFFRYFWLLFKSEKLYKQKKIDLLFIPGGSYLSKFRPFVTMNQNLLPFENKEISRYGFSLLTLKYNFLRIIQTITNKNSNGIIFLTPYAKKIVCDIDPLNLNDKSSIIIPHGVNSNFIYSPDTRIFRQNFTKNNPCKILYVSSIEVYKHQWKIIEGVFNLRKEGYHIKLIFVGSPGSGSKKFTTAIQKYDPQFDFIEYHSNVSYTQIKQFYIDADIGVFASSCETFGMILTESMNSSLPLIVSSMSAIPDVVGDCCLYFHPEEVLSFTNSVKQMINSVDLRKQIATNAFERVKKFSWQIASNKTFNFFKNVINQYKYV
jgi:glycosyltransferase involved in cell wall biosynthesis